MHNHRHKKNSNNKTMVWQFLGGFSLASSVGLGAFGAHGLDSHLQKLKETKTLQQKMPLFHQIKTELNKFLDPTLTTKNAASTPPVPPKEIWQRANHYQQLHSVGLLFVPVLTQPGSIARVIAGSSFVAGISLFSFGLYSSVVYGEKRLAKYAPVGGVAMMVGWLTLAVASRGRSVAASTAAVERMVEKAVTSGGKPKPPAL